jgi:hypothetical protein
VFPEQFFRSRNCVCCCSVFTTFRWERNKNDRAVLPLAWLVLCCDPEQKARRRVRVDPLDHPGGKPPADWPAQYTAFWATHPPAPANADAALRALERSAAWRSAHHDDDEDAVAERKAYLRGSQGQRDRETIWQRGLGRIGGEGGFMPGWRTLRQLQEADGAS